MHELWSGVLPRQVFADAPPAGFDAAPTRRTRRICAELIARHADELAAVIVEPVVQGAGGMRFHSPAICGCCGRRATRTTCCWCSTRSPPASAAPARCSPPSTRASRPDVMCVGKALTGGYLTLAATLCTSRVADGHLARRGAGARARADVHGQPAGRGRRRRLDRPAARPGLARRGQADRGRAAGRPGAGARTCPACATCGCSARSASSSSTTRSTWRRPPGPRSTRGVWLRPFRDLSTRCRRTSRRRGRSAQRSRARHAAPRRRAGRAAGAAAVEDGLNRTHT